MNLTQTPTRRRVLFAALYLSEGAPIGFIWWALPTELRIAGVDVDRITTLTALLVLPWTFKFLWAPLIDSVQSPRWGFRHWIVAAQTAMALAIAPLAFLDFETDFELVFALLLCHALAASTQDAAIDGWAINLTSSEERGKLTGLMQSGMLTGRWIFGAGLLLVRETVPRPAIFLFLAAVVWATSILVILSPDTATPAASGDSVRSFGATLRDALRRRTTWLGLGLAALGGAGFEAVGAVVGPFLIDRGYSPEAVGAFYTATIVAMLVGSLAGGFSADRIGHKRAVGLFLVFVAVAISATTVADATNTNSLVVPLLVTVYLGIGLFTAASYALFMDLTDPKLGATQFSAFMGATNGCEAWAGFTVGRLVAASGYPFAFIVMEGLSLLALPLLAAIDGREATRSQGSIKAVEDGNSPQ